MAFFNIKDRKYIPRPIPPTPPYVPPVPPTPPTPEAGDVPDIPKPTFTGSIDFKIYINNSDVDVMNKNLTLINTYSIILKNETNIERPSIIIESNSDLTDVNYMSINNMYYYAVPSSVNNNIWRFDGVIDGLMSFKEDILNSQCVVERSASRYNKYLNDNVPVAAYEQIKTLQFSNGFSKSLNYLLITTGSEGD